jgi:hypothetical protein
MTQLSLTRQYQWLSSEKYDEQANILSNTLHRSEKDFRFDSVAKV